MQDALGDRIKQYEDAYRLYLPRRQPLILRLDGVAHSTLTQGMSKPWDDRYTRAMNEATLLLCRYVQGAVLAYTQSDEISLLLIDYKRYNTEPWFGKNLQKMVSVAASTASVGFNHEMERLELPQRGLFDCRVIPLTREEVTNYFIWRQHDCRRNSILSLGQVNLGKRAIHGLSCAEIGQELSLVGIDWDQCRRQEKYGRQAKRNKGIQDGHPTSHWALEESWPFEEQRGFVDSLVWPEDEEGQYSGPRKDSKEIE